VFAFFLAKSVEERLELQIHGFLTRTGRSQIIKEPDRQRKGFRLMRKLLIRNALKISK
jgi:hypothetical protein